jgi:hypothetical protein
MDTSMRALNMTFTKATFTRVAVLALAASLMLTLSATSAEAQVAKPAYQSSGIWAPGTAWTGTVYERDRVSPYPTNRVFRSVYKMRVLSAPRTATGSWIVSMRLAGADGPYSGGLTLYYRKAASGTMVLKAVGYAGEYPVEVRYARLLAGHSAPLQYRVMRAPRNFTRDLR